MDVKVIDTITEITVIAALPPMDPIQVHPDRMKLFRPETVKVTWWKASKDEFRSIHITVSGPECRKGPGSMKMMHRTFWTDDMPTWLRKAREDMTPEGMETES
jgi:hypothetical protein